MASVTVIFRDGTTIYHNHVPRPGGSYTTRVRYDGNFAVVTDEYGKETAYPMDLVQRVESYPDRY